MISYAPSPRAQRPVIPTAPVARTYDSWLGEVKSQKKSCVGVLPIFWRAGLVFRVVICYGCDVITFELLLRLDVIVWVAEIFGVWQQIRVHPA